MAANDKAFIVEMINEYKVRVPAYINELCTAVDNKDLEEVRFVAHKLSSSLQIVGAHELVDITHKIEQMSLNNESPINLSVEAQKMLPLYKDVETELNKELAILK